MEAAVDMEDVGQDGSGNLHRILETKLFKVHDEELNKFYKKGFYKYWSTSSVLPPTAFKRYNM